MVGFLNVASPAGYSIMLTHFAMARWKVGTSRVKMLRSNIDGRKGADKLPEVAADLLRRQVSVIVANTRLI
jgi:hypothetical protein